MNSRNSTNLVVYIIFLTKTGTIRNSQRGKSEACVYVFISSVAQSPIYMFNSPKEVEDLNTGPPFIYIQLLTVGC